MKTIDGQSEYPWAGTAAAICGAVSALMLFGQSLTAIYYIERTIATRKEEIDQMSALYRQREHQARID